MNNFVDCIEILKWCLLHKVGSTREIVWVTPLTEHVVWDEPFVVRIFNWNCIAYKASDQKIGFFIVFVSFAF